MWLPSMWRGKRLSKSHPMLAKRFHQEMIWWRSSYCNAQPTHGRLLSATIWISPLPIRDTNLLRRKSKTNCSWLFAFENNRDSTRMILFLPFVEESLFLGYFSCSRVPVRVAIRDRWRLRIHLMWFDRISPLAFWQITICCFTGWVF